VKTTTKKTNKQTNKNSEKRRKKQKKQQQPTPSVHTGYCCANGGFHSRPHG